MNFTTIGALMRPDHPRESRFSLSIRWDGDLEHFEHY